MKRLLFRITILIIALFVLFLIFQFTGCMAYAFSPDIALKTSIIDKADFYVILKKRYLKLVTNKIDEFNKKRKLPYFINTIHINETIKLLEDTYILEKNDIILISGNKENIYFVIDKKSNFVFHRLNVFLKETFKINRKDFLISLLNTDNCVLKEISRIKTFKANPATNIKPPVRVLFKIYVNYDYNLIFITLDKNHLLNIKKLLKIKRKHLNLKIDENDFKFKIHFYK